MEYIIKYFLSPIKVKLPNTLISTSKNDSSMHMAKSKLNVSENMPRILQKLFFLKNTSYSETSIQMSALKFTIQKNILLLWHNSSYMNLYNGIKKIRK